MKNIELASEQRDALNAIAANPANGKELASALNIDRKTALALIADIDHEGFVVKNRNNRWELTIEGELAQQGDKINIDSAQVRADLMANVLSGAAGRVYAKSLRVVALRINRNENNAFNVSGYTEGGTAGQNGWASLAVCDATGAVLRNGRDLSSDLNDEALEQVAAVIAQMQPAPSPTEPTTNVESGSTADENKGEVTTGTVAPAVSAEAARARWSSYPLSNGCRYEETQTENRVAPSRIAFAHALAAQAMGKMGASRLVEGAAYAIDGLSLSVESADGEKWELCVMNLTQWRRLLAAHESVDDAREYDLMRSAYSASGATDGIPAPAAPAQIHFNGAQIECAAAPPLNPQSFVESQDYVAAYRRQMGVGEKMWNDDGQQWAIAQGFPIWNAPERVYA